MAIAETVYPFLGCDFCQVREQIAERRFSGFSSSTAFSIHVLVPMLVNHQDIEYMSDLQARISPQQPQERFPNKSWVRPGYENQKSPSSRTKHRPGKRKRSVAYGSDNSSHEEESEEPLGRRGASLRARLGIPDRGEEFEREMGSEPRSLINRIEPTEPEKEEENMHSLDRSGFSLGEGVETRRSPSHTREERRNGPPILDQGTNAIRVGILLY